MQVPHTKQSCPMQCRAGRPHLTELARAVGARLQQAHDVAAAVGRLDGLVAAAAQVYYQAAW